MNNEKTHQLLKQARGERAKLAASYEEIEAVRLPLDAYMCYCGTIGFSDYMVKHDVNPKYYDRVTSFNACGCMAANGQKESMSEFLEKELDTLNDIHKKFTEKILDMDERIANLELSTWEGTEKSEAKEKAVANIERNKKYIVHLRNKLKERIESWKKAADERREKRKAGKIPEKVYENPVDEMHFDEGVETSKKVETWFEKNHNKIMLGLSFIGTAATLIVLSIKVIKKN